MLIEPQHVGTGQRLRAADHNELVDAWRSLVEQGYAQHGPGMAHAEGEIKAVEDGDSATPPRLAVRLWDDSPRDSPDSISEGVGGTDEDWYNADGYPWRAPDGRDTLAFPSLQAYSRLARKSGGTFERGTITKSRVLLSEVYSVGQSIRLYRLDDIILFDLPARIVIPVKIASEVGAGEYTCTAYRPDGATLAEVGPIHAVDITAREGLSVDLPGLVLLDPRGNVFVPSGSGDLRVIGTVTSGSPAEPDINPTTRITVANDRLLTVTDEGSGEAKIEDNLTIQATTGSDVTRAKTVKITAGSGITATVSNPATGKAEVEIAATGGGGGGLGGGMGIWTQVVPDGTAAGTVYTVKAGVTGAWMMYDTYSADNSLNLYDYPFGGAPGYQYWVDYTSTPPVYTPGTSFANIGTATGSYALYCTGGDLVARVITGPVGNDDYIAVFFLRPN